MNANIKEQLDRLEAWFNGCTRVGVAFSGGVDSTLLLAVAHRFKGANVIAFTARIASQPTADVAFTQAFCNQLGIEQVMFDLDELSIPGFENNPTNRCYLCKKRLYCLMKELAPARGLDRLVDGTNADDLKVERPGRQALQEEGVGTPFADCGLTKSDVRSLSQELALPTWDKPSNSCFYTRIGFDEPLTQDKLAWVQRTEAMLEPFAFKRVRARLNKGQKKIEIEI